MSLFICPLRSEHRRGLYFLHLGVFFGVLGVGGWALYTDISRFLYLGGSGGSCDFLFGFAFLLRNKLGCKKNEYMGDGTGGKNRMQIWEESLCMVGAPPPLGMGVLYSLAIFGGCINMRFFCSLAVLKSYARKINGHA